MGKPEPKAWTIILEDAEATDRDIVALGRRLVQTASEAGFTLRVKTVEAWMLKARKAPLNEPVRVPGELPMARMNGRRMGPRG